MCLRNLVLVASVERTKFHLQIIAWGKPLLGDTTIRNLEAYMIKKGHEDYFMAKRWISQRSQKFWTYNTSEEEERGRNAILEIFITYEPPFWNHKWSSSVNALPQAPIHFTQRNFFCAPFLPTHQCWQLQCHLVYEIWHLRVCTSPWGQSIFEYSNQGVHGLKIPCQIHHKDIDQMSQAKIPNMLVQNFINGKNNLRLVKCFSFLYFLLLNIPAILC